jgi:hypothetical protein
MRIAREIIEKDEFLVPFPVVKFLTGNNTPHDKD